MKVFLAWSGDISKRAADAFHAWIPNVLQTVEPFMSEEDIAVGSRWSRQLDQELDESNFGVIFVTPDNYDKPWVVFEAGALSKSIADSRVSPLLVGITRTTLTGPLTHFQSALPNRHDIKRLISSINEASGDACLDDERLERVFNTWWAELEPALASLVEEAQGTSATGAQDRPPNEIMAETLDVVRSVQRALSDPMTLVPPDYLEFALERIGGFDSFPSDLWPDLERGWRQFNHAIQQVDEDDPQSSLAGVVKASHRLRRPVEFLVDESRRRRRAQRDRFRDRPITEA